MSHTYASASIQRFTGRRITGRERKLHCRKGKVDDPTGCFRYIPKRTVAQRRTDETVASPGGRAAEASADTTARGSIAQIAFRNPRFNGPAEADEGCVQKSVNTLTAGPAADTASPCYLRWERTIAHRCRKRRGARPFRRYRSTVANTRTSPLPPESKVPGEGET